HVDTHLQLVFAVGSIEDNQRKSPFVFFIRRQGHPVTFVRKHFPEPAQVHPPGARLGKAVFEGSSETLLAYPPRPAVAEAAALIAETADIVPFVLPPVAV